VAAAEFRPLYPEPPLLDSGRLEVGSHRLSTIAAMDRLVVLDRGRVIETGTHAELLMRSGHYARLWERQSNGFVDPDVAAG
jgi:ATP-binding cassette subfamily B multidrug efflux pump